MSRYNGTCDGSLIDFQNLLTIPLHDNYATGDGFADSTTGEFPREPSVEQEVIDLTAEHDGDEVIDLSDPLQEEEFNGDAAEVLPPYENCLGRSDCEPGCSTSQHNGWVQSSWASDHSACADDDDEADWSGSPINAWGQASWSGDNSLPSSGQQTPNTIQPSIHENNAWDQDSLPSSGQQTPNSIQLPVDENNDGNLELAQIEQLHIRLDAFDRRLNALEDRMRQVYGQQGAHDGAFHLGLDRQRLAIEETAHDPRQQIQNAENSMNRLHDLTFEQMRERRLMFEAVYAMVFPIFYP
ncbi:uncharacterized protein [Misgurnus anguillicaudatus]|uniref:uncharacterized protein n=1 Tax=Misgurnus anguillicaudatus TaxID=75329 RepID=UPI003CCF98BF